MSAPVLKSGTIARWDSFSGLIPVRILAIKPRLPGKVETRPSSEHEVEARVVRSVRPYKAGEIVRGWSLHFVPPAALIRREYDMRIGAYEVEQDPVTGHN